MTVVPVLEIGGTHATSLLVDTSSWAPRAHPVGRVAIDGQAPADELLASLASSLAALGPLDGATAAIAIPGPFDYARGIGRFRDVGKFEALNGVDIGAGLGARLATPPADFVFVNDAAAFALGEWLGGAARGVRRSVAITLGTGVGSAFVADGAIVADGPCVPPEGYVYRLTVDGLPLESVVSRRAILARYQGAGGPAEADVRDVARRALSGDAAAREAFIPPLITLGVALAPWVARFRAEVLVVGGAMSASWSLVEPALRSGLRAGRPPVNVPVRPALDREGSAAVGAAWHAVRRTQGPPA